MVHGKKLKYFGKKMNGGDKMIIILISIMNIILIVETQRYLGKGLAILHMGFCIIYFVTMQLTIFNQLFLLATLAIYFMLAHNYKRK